MVDDGRNSAGSNAVKLLLIGLDGATLDLIEPWAEQGHLPALRALMQRGAWGRLQSTVPAMTFPAWSSIMTGVNPGEHGIFDFTYREPGTYRVRYTNSTFRAVPTLWQILTRRGARVTALAFPTTFPPEPVNGYMISGFDSPVTVGINRRFMQPPELYDELLQHVGKFTITGFQELRIGPNWHSRALASLLDVVGLKERTASYLLDKGPWDVFAVLFGESDTVSHHFWAYHDPASPRHVPPSDPALAQSILSVYQRLDRAVAALVERAGPDATVIIVSDHGFGGTSDRVLFLNRLLASWGYLSLPATRPFSRWTSGLKRAALTVLPAAAQELLFRVKNNALANWLETRSRAAAFAVNGTRAFSDELNYFPSIWLHTRDRFPDGTVEPGAEARALSRELIKRLEDFRDPETGEQVVERAYSREDVYWGTCVNRAPHIILELANPDGYSWICGPSEGRAGPLTRRLTRREFIGAKGASMNGSHRPDGTLIMAGTGIAPVGEIYGTNVLDVLPTALAVLHQPLPQHVEGRILTEALTDPRSSWEESEDNGGAESGPGKVYTPEEEAEVERRLRDLGYIE